MMIDYIRRNLKSLIVYTLFGLFVYFIVIYLTFPYEKIVSNFISSIEKRYDCKLQTGSISPILPLGVKASAVSFLSRNLTGGQAVKIDSIKATVPFMGLLLYPFTGSISSNFYISFPKGKLAGQVRIDPDILDLSLNTKKLDLDSLKPILVESGLILKGIADADIVSSINRKDLTKSGMHAILKGRGELNIEFKDFSIQIGENSSGRSSFGQMGTFLAMIPSIPAIKTKALINNGLVQFKELYIEKEGLKGNIQGVIKLEERTDDTLLDLTLNLTMEPDESLLRPILSLYGGAIGCPLSPNNTVSCKINGTIGELTNP